MIELINNETFSGIEITDNVYTLHLRNSADREKVMGVLEHAPAHAHLVARYENHQAPCVAVISKDLVSILADLAENHLISHAEKVFIENHERVQSIQQVAQVREAQLQVALQELAILMQQAEEENQVDDKVNVAHVDNREEAFASVEHRAIGNKAFAKLLDENDDNSDLKFLFPEDVFYKNDLNPAGAAWSMKLSNGAVISMGDITALAGDFFGVPSEPIAHGKDELEKRKRFLKAFAQLEHASAKEIQALLETFDEEWLAVNRAVKGGQSPKLALEALNKGMRKDIKYTWLTNGRYLALSIKNYDHFGADAKEAYRVGHELAMELARAASGHEDEAKKAQLLARALAYEAFACHFLTDLFSAGHMRTPRHQLFNDLKKHKIGLFAEYRAAYRAYKMHHEDNEQGLQVKSVAHQAAWRAYGDECLFESNNTQTYEYVIEAMHAGLSDVYGAFLGQPYSYSYEEHVPEPLEANHQPMYAVVEGAIQTRSASPPLAATAESAPSMKKLYEWFRTHRPHLVNDGVADDEEVELLERAMASCGCTR